MDAVLLKPCYDLGDLFVASHDICIHIAHILIRQMGNTCGKDVELHIELLCYCAEERFLRSLPCEMEMEFPGLI